MSNNTTPTILSVISLSIAGFAFYQNVSLRSELNDKISDIEQAKVIVEFPKQSQPNPPFVIEQKEAKQELVVVDFQDIYNAYRTQSGADNQLNQVVNTANTALNTKRTELKDLLTQIKTNQEALKKEGLQADELDKIKTEITNQLTKAQSLNELITQKAQVIQQNVNQEAQRINQSLYSDIQRIIKRKAQALGVRYVINSQAKDATQTPVFLYSMETTDLTGDIMKEIGLKPTQASNNTITPTIPKPAEAQSTEASETESSTPDNSKKGE